MWHLYLCNNKWLVNKLYGWVGKACCHNHRQSPIKFLLWLILNSKIFCHKSLYCSFINHTEFKCVSESDLTCWSLRAQNTGRGKNMNNTFSNSRTSSINSVCNENYIMNQSKLNNFPFVITRSSFHGIYLCNSHFIRFIWSTLHEYQS